MNTALLVALLPLAAQVPAASSWVGVCPAPVRPWVVLVEAAPEPPREGTRAWRIGVSAVDAAGRAVTFSDVASAPESFDGIPASPSASVSVLEGGVLRAWSPQVTVAATPEPGSTDVYAAELAWGGVRCDGMVVALRARGGAALLVDPASPVGVAVGGDARSARVALAGNTWPVPRGVRALPVRRKRNAMSESVLAGVDIAFVPTLRTSAPGDPVVAWRMDAVPPRAGGRLNARAWGAAGPGTRIVLVDALVGDGAGTATWLGALVERAP